MRDDSRINTGQRRRPNGHRGWARWALVVVVASACGSADDKFAAETSDEYVDPLGEVTIGEPGGIVTTFPAQPGSLAADEDGGTGPVDAGPDVPMFDASFDIGGGSGGRSGAGGSFGVGGSAGRGGAAGSGGGARKGRSRRLRRELRRRGR